MNRLNRNDNDNNNNNDTLMYFRNDDYIGMEKTQAFKLCASRGLGYRVVQENGVSFMVTMDIRMDRLNFNIDNDVVVSFHMG